MKKIFRILLLFLCLGLFLYTNSALAASSLSNVNLGIDPDNASSLGTWTISFIMPETSQVGHILISLGGYQPDLSQATLSVSGLPAGTAVVGKSNPSCVSNCDDVRYYFKDLIEIKGNTKVTLTLSNVKNPVQAGETGINFINIFSSKYPNMTLTFSTGEQLINLEPAQNLPEENLIPQTATNENTNQAPEQQIQQVIINELFYKQGAKTTKLSEIKDAAKVEDFTIDLLGKVKVYFKGLIDLSKPEAISFIENFTAYMTFDDLYFKVDKKLMDYFKVPLEITYYNLPFVWDPDVLKDDDEVLTKDKLENYRSYVIDDNYQVSFVIKEAGAYRLIPHFELYITDNQEIKKASNLVTFTGRISDPKAVIKISLNSKELKDFKPAIDLQKGEFTFSAELLEGSNLIEAEAQSEYGKIDKITKIVQYLPPQAGPVAEKEVISPVNIAVIVLAILAIILIISLRYLVKKK